MLIFQIKQTCRCTNCNGISTHYDELISIDMDTSTLRFLQRSSEPKKCLDSTIRIQVFNIV